tara:strand:+ start:724 stop:927 length:204 start_codon:yes stop_codon:yes gene_type:complete
LLFFDQSLFTPRYKSSWDAIKVDEYVPTNTPIIIARVNPFITSPPKKYNENKAIKVVNEVKTVLDRV